MEKIELKGVDQNVYYEQLDSGLKVFVLPYSTKKNYYAVYGTKYGSINLEFKCNSKMFKSNSGVAHFLEHKMFEQENGEDPFEFFAKTGTTCNASTSYKKTMYYINGINELDNNLIYLINCVNSPYFTDENVQKEKGIIIEEIKMYADNPDWLLVEEMYKAAFKNHPVRENIAGYESTVNKITKEELYDCYNIFYQPSNMYLLVGGNVNPTKIIDLIKNIKTISKKKSVIENSKINEPDNVNNSYKELKCDSVSVPKLGLIIKTNFKNEKDKYEYVIYINLILGILFGSASSFKEKIFKDKYATSLYTDSMILGDNIILEFFSETTKPKELAEKILNQFSNDITEDEFKRYIKVQIASQVMLTDIIEPTIDNIISDLVNWDKLIPNKIEILKKLNVERINAVKNSINVKNSSVVILREKD